MKLSGPARLKLEIGILNETGTKGVLTTKFGKNVYPTEEEVAKAISEFENKEMPLGFRLMTEEEWKEWNFDYVSVTQV